MNDNNTIKWVDVDRNNCPSRIAIEGMAPVTTNGVVQAIIAPNFTPLEYPDEMHAMIVRITLYPTPKYAVYKFQDNFEESENLDDKVNSDNPKFENGTFHIALTFDDQWFGLRIKKSLIPGTKSLPKDQRYVFSPCPQSLPSYLKRDVKALLSAWVSEQGVADTGLLKKGEFEKLLADV